METTNNCQITFVKNPEDLLRERNNILSAQEYRIAFLNCALNGGVDGLKVSKESHNCKSKVCEYKGGCIYEVKCTACGKSTTNWGRFEDTFHLLFVATMYGWECLNCGNHLSYTKD